MDITKLKCRRCGGHFPMAQIRMDPTTKGYVCLDCMNVSDRLSHSKKMTSVSEMDRLREERRKNKSDKAEFITYRCPKCKYKTRFKSENVPKKCSYCGGTVDLDQNEESDVDQLLRDVSEPGIVDR